MSKWSAGHEWYYEVIKAWEEYVKNCGYVEGDIKDVRELGEWAWCECVAWYRNSIEDPDWDGEYTMEDLMTWLGTAHAEGNELVITQDMIKWAKICADLYKFPHDHSIL